VRKDFLAISDLSADEINEIFDLTKEVKAKNKQGEIYHPLTGKTMAMIFQKPSARTRISFETGMYQLGGYALYLGPNDVQIGKREAVSDIGQVISRYNDIIMARLFGHEDILEMAEYATVPVINGLTDLLHPCQILADAFTIIEHKGKIENQTIAYIGDGNNICNSWLNLALKIPINLNLGIPEGYEPDKEILSMAKRANVSNIQIFHNPKLAAKNADVIYTDVWASMGQEKEAERRKLDFTGFQIDDALVSHANEDCIVLHCLPAHRGEEITDSVVDGPHSVVFDEAENRMHVQKAIIIKLMT
jgi:ornithine carbamoyltransferase